MDGSIMPTSTLLEIEDLTVRFVTREATVHAVNGVSLQVKAGEVLCILGESGSGKSVTLRALMRLLPAGRTRIDGRITLDGRDVLNLDRKGLQAMRGGLVSMIFQEPMTALDPVYTVGEQIVETVRQHRGGTRAEARARALELFELVKIPSPERRLDAYPHELSGGLRQRAVQLCEREKGVPGVQGGVDPARLALESDLACEHAAAPIRRVGNRGQVVAQVDAIPLVRLIAPPAKREISQTELCNVADKSITHL